MSSVSLIELPKIRSERGSITSINNFSEVPFQVKRVYYLYDVPSASERGGHAHKELNQLIIAASGSFNVVLDDGKRQKTFNLNQPNFGLLIKPGLWRELKNFSSGAICLVLASERYSEADYIRSYEDFLSYRESNQGNTF